MRIKHIIFCCIICIISVSFLGCEKESIKFITEEVAEEPDVIEKTESVDKVEIPSGVLVFDDFDDGEKPNNLGGDFGVWNKDPNDSTQYCRDSFDPLTKINKTGYSLRLDYDVDSPSPAYNGFWSKLDNIDLSMYSQLIFYVKGDKDNGYTTKFKLEIKNAKGETGKYLVTGLTDYWQRVFVSFSKVADITDWCKMTEFVIVFDDLTVSKKVGTIYIDDIYFE